MRVLLIDFLMQLNTLGRHLSHFLKVAAYLNDILRLQVLSVKTCRRYNEAVVINALRERTLRACEKLLIVRALYKLAHFSARLFFRT